MAEYIEREALINQIRLMVNRSSVGETSLNDISAKTICGLILEAPTADVVEVKHGEWGHKYSLHKIVCLNCGTPRPYQKTKRGYHLAWDSNYCPNCGAKMDLKEGAEE